MHALILAGGLGTRLRPLTNLTPKPLLPFLGEPYAFGLLRRLRAVGVGSATFLVGRDAEPFQPLVEAGPQLGVDVGVLTEERPLDTAGGARRLFTRARPEGPVLVCNGDVLTDLDLGELLAAHERTAATATLALTPVEDTSAFGVVVTDDDGRVRRFVEKPPPGTIHDDTINAGTYVLAPDAFEPFPGDGPLSFERTVFPGLLDAGRRLTGVRSTAYWQDLGTPARYLDGQEAFLEGRCDWPVGSALQRHDHALVHTSARIDPDAHIGSGVVIGPDVVVAAGAYLARCALHERVVVGERAVVVDALVAHDSVIAPRVSIPPGSVLGPRTIMGG